MRASGGVVGADPEADGLRDAERLVEQDGSLAALDLGQDANADPGREGYVLGLEAARLAGAEDGVAECVAVVERFDHAGRQMPYKHCTSG